MYGFMEKLLGKISLFNSHYLLAFFGGFDWVDLIILIGVGYAAVRGAQLGAAVQLGSYGGFWVGLFLGAAVGPRIAAQINSQFLRTTVLLLIVFGFASIIGGIGRHLGGMLSTRLSRVHLSNLNSSVGGGVAVVATLLVVWVVSSVAVNLPFAGLSQQVAQSEIVRTITKVMPPAPSVFSRIQAFVNSAGFPAVFASVPPAISGPVNLPTQAAVSQVSSEVQNSVVKIEGIGCGQIQEGSGFVVSPNEVVTNAHVVAGTGNISIFDSAGQHPAVVVAFNPELDIAILRTTSLTDAPLTIDPTVSSRGGMGVVLGYPGGGPLTTSSAGVMDAFTAQGRDIYNRNITDRLVYELEAIIRPGNSGGPIVNMSGQVIGVVFSRSTTNPDVGFALAMPAVLKQISAASSSDASVSTGACAA